MTYNFSKTASSVYTKDFECYKSNICHLLHQLGDIEFIKTILIDDTITQFADNNLIAQALYLLAMLDYISKENNVPICTKYNQLRQMKMKRLIIPVSINLGMKLFKNDEIFQQEYKKAIPEFLKYNIMESDVRNVN